MLILWTITPSVIIALVNNVSYRTVYMLNPIKKVVFKAMKSKRTHFKSDFVDTFVFCYVGIWHNYIGSR